ncbi:PAS domain S-box protein [Phenylobacterium sp.]|uniref:PAS domain-containing hybrid sensor histidine kinase/response regulator n=1 Tax=Phenylobacterium sp. TaxID=1871053 RepID=UPI00301C4E91
MDRQYADAEALAFIAEHASDVIVRTNRAGVLTYVSPSIRRYGYEPGDMIGKAYSAFAHPDDLAVLSANSEALLAGMKDPDANRLHRFRAGDGRWAWAEGAPHVVFDDNGEVVEIINIFRDVTARVAQAEAASEEARQFEAAFRYAAIGKALVGLDGGFMRVNDAFCRLVGYTEAEALALDFQTLTHPADLDADLEQLGALTAGAIDSYRMEKRYVRKDGGEVWVHLTVSIVRGDDGTPRHYVAQVEDLTERHAAQAALRDSEARYRLLAENSEDVTVQLSLTGEIRYVSPAVRAYGYAPEALEGRLIREFIHPDDLEQAGANLAAALGGQPSPNHLRQLRFRSGRGDWVCMEGNARALRDAAGAPEGFVTTLRDVTERLEQEALFKAAFEHAAIAKSMVGLDGRLLWANEAACRLTGYGREELIGTAFADMVHPDEAGMDGPKIEALRRGRIASYESERRFRRIDGGYVWVRQTVSLARHADGRPKYFLAEVEDLTERHAAQAALSRSEELYRLIAENTSDMIVMSDLNGVATYASPSVRAAGRQLGEVQGRSFRDNVHPGDIAVLSKAFVRLLSGAHIQQVRWRGRNAAGDGWVWLESNPSLVRDPRTGEPTGFLDVIRNVQHQVEQEEALARAHAEAQTAARALQESEARYRLISHNTSDIIVMAEPTGRISFISPSIASLGYTPEELVGTAFTKQMHPDDLPRVWGELKDLPAGATSTRMRWRAQHKVTGEWIWVESQPTMLRNPETGAAAGFLDVVRNVTQQVQQEQELAAARAAAEAAAAAKSQFLANMSHEIRTPLTAVLGFTGLLDGMADLPPAAAGHVDRIAAAGKGLLAIVNDILDFSKLEAGKFEIRPAPTDLAAVCRESLLLFSGQAETKGLTLAFEATPDLPHAVMMDGDRLRQTLINLVGNAVKFTEAGGVTLSIGEAAPGVVSVAVSDTGPGLDAEAQAVLFQRFTQIDGSMTRRHGGTGLGLAICRGIAEAMGGEIAVESAPGRGATFRLTLPAPPVGDRQAEDDAAPALSVEGLRVFLVDDNATNRELGRRILEAAGAIVHEAQDGAEAVARLGLLPADVVLMDLRMPGLDGRGALARLRATPGPNQRTPVLAFTADADVRTDGDLDGFDGLVRKPIQPMEMYAAIAEAALLSRGCTIDMRAAG